MTTRPTIVQDNFQKPHNFLVVHSLLVTDLALVFFKVRGRKNYIHYNNAIELYDFFYIHFTGLEITLLNLAYFIHQVYQNHKNHGSTKTQINCV